MVNDLFVAKLAEYAANPAAAEVFKRKVALAFSGPVGTNKAEIRLLSNQVTDANDKIKKARESYLNGTFDEVDFRSIKLENEKKCKNLKIEFSNS